MRYIVFFAFIAFIGLILRLHNLSPFNIYPDSYQSLLVASNISTYHSVVGFLGHGGMAYPDFFMWTRPGYPLLILLINLFVSMTLGAHIVSMLMGIIGIVVAYFLIKTIFRSTFSGMIGAFLLAFSFNHTVWSGLIMTETTGVLFMTLFLWSIFNSLSRKAMFGDLQDILTGFLFACAILTRYEYAILIFPVVFLYITCSKNPLPRLLTFFSIVVLCIAFSAGFLFPLRSVISVILHQLGDILQVAAVLSIISLLILSFILKRKYFLQRNISGKIHYAVLGITWFFAFYLLVQFLFGVKVAFLYNDFSFVRSFVMHDMLISIFSFVGLSILLIKQEYRQYGFFCLFSLVSLGFLYHQINPDMERYMTHTIPFLLIPASLGLTITLRKIDKFFLDKKYVYFLEGALIILLLFVGQGYISFQGLRYTRDSSWYRTSYEEKSAVIAQRYIPSNNSLLIVSIPEAYFWQTHTPTQSIADTYPFVYISDLKFNQTVYIVVDMPMHEIFPVFTKFVIKNLQDYTVATYFVHETYHQTNTVMKELFPVTIYKISLRDLKEKIKK